MLKFNIKFAGLIMSLVFLAVNVSAQENCFNGIDDDFDGDIDLNDEDCICNGITELDIFDDFEDMDCCPEFPTGGLGTGLWCLEQDWMPVSGTADYFHECGYMGSTPVPPPPQPFPSGQGMVGSLNHTPPGHDPHGEYIGQCLDCPLIAGETYEFSVFVGFNDGGDTWNSVSPVDFAIFGNEECVSPSFFGCLETRPGWDVLVTETAVANMGEWTFVSGSFVASANYQMIAFGTTCQPERTYTFYDDFSFSGNVVCSTLELDDDILIAGDCISGIELFANGLPGFDIQWYHEGVAIPGATSLSFAVPAGQEGSYTAMVHGANECAIYDAVDVMIDEQVLQFDGDVADVNCLEFSDGFIDLDLPSQNAPFTISWDTGESGPFISGLTPGAYNVTVTDANGCFNVETFFVDGPDDLLTGTINSVTQPSGDVNVGSATANVSGGTASYTYLWSNGETTPTATDLPPGLNTVLITDINGCEVVLEVLILEPLTVDIEHLDDFCGLCEGAISIMINGGLQDYSIEWETGSTDTMLTDLCTAAYSFTVTDDFGTEISGSQNIISTDPIDLSLTQSDLLICNGSNAGFITTGAFGGTEPYAYIWSNDSTSNSLSNLSPGIYALTVQDANSCMVEQEFTVIELPEITVENTIQEPDCNGGQNGEIELTITGGDEPYTILWEDGSDSQLRNNLPAGDYFVTVTDSEGCSINSQIDLIGSVAFEIEETIVNASCSAVSDGSVNLEVSGISNPSFLWEDGSTGSSIEELISGVYIVTISDGNGCDVTLTYEVEAVPLFEFESTFSERICADSSDGFINLQNSDNENYSFLWEHGSTEQNIDNLPFGTYTVTITNDIGCEKIESYVIEQGEQIEFNAVVNNVDCIDSQNGSITTTVSGGVGNVLLNWESEGSDSMISNLSVGDYTLMAIDDLGCMHSETFVIESESNIQLNETIANAGCDDEPTGSIDISVDGGVSPYSFIWDNGSVENNITDLSSGMYTVIVEDALGCTTTENYEINDVGSLDVAIAVGDPSCFGQEDGTISIQVGNTMEISEIRINGIPSNLQNSDLTAGDYLVEVTDVNGCKYEEVIQITSPLPLEGEVVGVSHINPDLFGSATINVLGGVAPHTLSWDNGEQGNTANMLLPGVHEVMISDANGCSTVLQVIIEGPKLILERGVTNNICFDDCEGRIELQLVESFGDITFEWSIGEATQTISNLCNGIYFVTVSDTYNNQEIVEVEIQGGDRIEASSVSSPISCEGESDGSIAIEIQGGEGPYTIMHNGMPFTGSNLDPGTYDIIIQDSNGCEIEHSAVVEDVIVPSLEIVITDPDCERNGAIEIENFDAFSGGILISGNDISTQLSSDMLDNLFPGLYTLDYIQSSDCIHKIREITLLDFDPSSIIAPIESIIVKAGSTEVIGINDLEFDENYTIEWIAEENYTCKENDMLGNCISIEISPLNSTRIFANVISEYGCSQIFEFEINVERDYVIYAPNIISGNGQSTFKLIANNDLSYIQSFSVFSRWGERVYVEKNIAIAEMNGWDLTYKNQIVSSGVYAYIVNFIHPNGEEGIMAGDITVIR